MCIFARQNVCSDPPFSRLDLISCRNILIYLGAKAQKTVLLTLNYALRPGGYLLLGSSESILQHADIFTLSERKHKFYLKVGTATPPVDFALPLHGRELTAAVDQVPIGPPNTAWTEVDLQRAADRIVLSRYGPAGVVINDKMEVLQVRGHTAPFLEYAQGVPTFNLLKMARSDLASTLRGAVQRAIAEDIPIKVEGIAVRDVSAAHELAIEVLPIHSPPPKTRCYLILFLPQPATIAELKLTQADVSRVSGSEQDGLDITASARRSQLHSPLLAISD